MRVIGCLYLALTIALPFQKVFAQSSTCSEVLVDARSSFEAGHLYSIPAMLKPCLDNGFDKGQKIQAYWLLARTYLLIDDPISAEDSYLKLLRLDPEYNIDEDLDPIDLVYLSNKFTTTPIFVLFAKVGTNFISPQVIHNFGMDNTQLLNEEYTSLTGFHVSAGGEYNASDKFSFGLEFMFSQSRYNYSNTFFNNDFQTLDEQLTFFNIPVYVKYRLKFNKIRPYLYAGYSSDFLLSSTGSAELLDRVSSVSPGEEVAEFPVTGPDISLTQQRRFYNSSIFAGIGANYRIGYNYIFIDARYAFGLSNIVDIQNQYSNAEFLYKYAFVDNYKRLNTLSISIGFVKPLYKPRKKSERKAKFIKELFNKKRE